MIWRDILYGLMIAVYPLALIAAAFSDIRTLRIPNWISISLLAAFLAANWAAGWSGSVLLRDLACGAVLLGIGLILFARGLIGGGDAKLLAVIAVWTGWPIVLKFVLLTALAGGGLALTLLIFRNIRIPAPVASVRWLKMLHAQTQAVPYGVAIAAAGLVVFWELPLRAGFGG